MLHDRDPLFTMISDKLRVRDYLEGKVGRDYLVPLLWTGEDPEEIPFEEITFQVCDKDKSWMWV